MNLEWIKRKISRKAETNKCKEIILTHIEENTQGRTNRIKDRNYE